VLNGYPEGRRRGETEVPHDENVPRWGSKCEPLRQRRVRHRIAGKNQTTSFSRCLFRAILPAVGVHW